MFYYEVIFLIFLVLLLFIVCFFVFVLFVYKFKFLNLYFLSIKTYAWHQQAAANAHSNAKWPRLDE